MSARVWTREELDRVYPLPDGWAWARLPSGAWCARRTANGARSTVFVRGGTLCAECSVPMAAAFDIDPPDDVALAVILASRGLDSREAMADAAATRASTHREMARMALADGKPTVSQCAELMASAFDEDAAMLRRGTVEP
jgi:3-oxoacyl-ACP reductase-like protein